MSPEENAKRHREEFISVNRPIENWKKRKCLSCGKVFMSTGKFNKICAHCKRGPAFQWDMEGHSLGRKK
jgi:hypothetical protein